MFRSAVIVSAILGSAVVFAMLVRLGSDEPEVVSANVVAFMSAAPDDVAFARVTEPRALVFPEDEGAHPEYRTEWWYYTGNLEGDDGRRFGFQLTFFRNALAPEAALAERDSAWGTGQLHLAHFTVTDVEGKTFHSAERLARGAAGLAGAEAEPYRVWLEDWRAEREEGPDGPVRLVAADGPVAIDLALTPAKPVALHGDGGFSPKGPEPGNASFYYSYPRLDAEGGITTADGEFAVTGTAWMDHEWSTSALDGASQEGWDWFSLQLDDGRELMVFQIREQGGGVSAESSGSLIAPDASVTSLGRDDFTIKVLDRWRSPRTGAAYPSGWRVVVPESEIDLTVEPLLADQELQTFIRYWEGAVRVQGQAGAEPVSGHGYVELTGYVPESGLPGG